LGYTGSPSILPKNERQVRPLDSLSEPEEKVHGPSDRKATGAGSISIGAVARATNAEKTQQTANLPLKLNAPKVKDDPESSDNSENIRSSQFGTAATYRTANLPLKLNAPKVKDDPDSCSNSENRTSSPVRRGTTATYRTANLPLKLNAVGDNQHNGGSAGLENGRPFSQGTNAATYRTAKLKRDHPEVAAESGASCSGVIRKSCPDRKN
jgi:hypothetical protein